MKTQNVSFSISYKDYLFQLFDCRINIDLEEIQPLLDRFMKAATLPFNNIAAFFIIDYTKSKYTFFTNNIKNIIGFHSEQLLEEGLEFSFQIMHPKFAKCLNEGIFPASFRLLKTLNQSNHSDLIFSHTNKFVTKDGKWLKILQKSTYITSIENGLPLFCLGSVTDITNYSKVNNMVQVIEKKNPELGRIELLETNFFFPYEEDAILTRQEKNILKYIMDGFSTKMVADKLFISEKTVTNHRQNIMRKTNCKNLAQMISYAIKHEII